MNFSHISPGLAPPKDLNVIIEISAHAGPVKYEVDKDLDALVVDRFMPAPMFYPANYGYIPQTLAGDGDPLDVLVVTPCAVQSGAIVRCRPIGVLNMTDEKGQDIKVLAVPHDNITSLYHAVQEYTDLPVMLLKQIEHFFENYKKLEPNKWVKVDQWEEASVACRVIEKTIQAYGSK